MSILIRQPTYQELPISANTSSCLSSALQPGRRQLSFIVALRAFAALIIVFHHFALYPPLREWAAPLLGDVLDWFEHHARATQVFFVIGGYVMARSMCGRQWHGRQVVSFVTERYVRLGVPYLAVIALVLPVYVFARGWVPEEVLGSPVSWAQLLAHLFFLQDILGYEALSAGLWFVCINFQLGLIFATGLWLRDGLGKGNVDFVGLAGWGLAIFSLFYANLDSTWDATALYFFPYFFMGIMVHRAQRGGQRQLEFWLYQLLVIFAMYYEWRWRLGVALIVGLLLLASDKKGFGERWPRNRSLAWLGRISYSLFLVHFPVLILVATFWARLGWNSPSEAVGGLLAAFFLSIVVAAFFHRWIELPAAQLARTIKQVGMRGKNTRQPAWDRA